MFEGNGNETRFDVVRCDRASGKKTVMKNWGQIEGRWPAEEALKRLRETNRDPNVEFELRESGKEKEFRATAFGDSTSRFAAWQDDEDK